MFKSLLPSVLAFAVSFLLPVTGEAFLFDFSDSADNLSPQCRTSGGRVSLFTEPSTWNRCGKLEVIAANTNKDGYVVHSASVIIGCGADGHFGCLVKPNTLYRFSIEIRHEVPLIEFATREWTGDDFWKDMKYGKTSVGQAKTRDEWTIYSGTFRTSADSTRAALALTLWTSTQYPHIEQAKVGDYVLFDNVAIEEAPDVMSALKGRKFEFAPVPVVSDYKVPFLPAELLDPPTNITIRAAVNDRKSLPVAVANATDHIETYRVVVESIPEGQVACNGTKGLGGFPPGNVKFRKALTFRSSNTGGRGNLRLDPLPEMDASCTVTVPPGDSGLVWFEFDTTGVRPGVYCGRIRVIPLGENAEWKSSSGFYRTVNYKGPMRDVPLSLQVLPFELPKEPSLPLGFFQPAPTESAFNLMTEVGVREFGVDPSIFNFRLNKDGNIVPELVSEAEARLKNYLGLHRQWAKDRGVEITYFIGFGVVSAFRDLYAKQIDNDRTVENRLWGQWCRALACGLEAYAVGLDKVVVELYDEPKIELHDEIMEKLRIAHDAAPGLKLSLTMGAHLYPAERMEELAQYVDHFTLCHWGYFTGTNRLDFIARQQQKGKTFSHYTCSTKMSASLNLEFRGNAWFARRYGLNGCNLFWFTDSLREPGDSDWKVTTWGGVAYRSFDDYIPSIRYMAMREGVSDMRYFSLLERIAGRDPMVMDFLQQAVNDVVGGLAHDRTAADRFREKAIDMLLEKLKKGNDE